MQFLKTYVVLQLFSLLCLVEVTRTVSDVESLMVGFFGPTDSSGWRGAVLGVSEVNRQGRYFGKEIVLERIALSGKQTHPLLIASVKAVDVMNLAGSDRVVVSIGSPDDELRTACVPGLFFTNPSEGMLAEALVRWRQERPETSARSLAWHPLFLKYAARDLNKRYKTRFNESMDSEAWAGWAAARIFGEAFISGNAKTPESTALFFRDRLSFDGQKGTALSFRSDGQLRQIILLVEDDVIVGELPRVRIQLPSWASRLVRDVP